MKTREELLAELGKLTHPDGRKVRSDRGLPRQSYKKRSGERIDKGQPREVYSTEGPGYHKRLFTQFISLHLDPSGVGDTLTRDVNMIFPPHVTSFYKLVRPKNAPAYRSSVKRKNHPEELRWNWFMAEYKADPVKWEDIVSDWYFITPEDLRLGLWTYNEWAWAYTEAIDGHENRISDHNKVILLYDAFAEGAYGYVKYDNKGDIVWKK